MTMSPTTFPFRTSADDDGVLCAFRRGTISAVLAQVVRIDLGFAGLVQCRLKLSIGEVSVHGNRDSISLSLKPGDWVRVRVLRHYRVGPSQLRVLSMVATDQGCGLAWLPLALCHRTEHLSRLRQLLAGLEPAMQAIFMAAMSDAQVQRRFFWRVAASDHHGYPGGLFDQSVKAAELASKQAFVSNSQRGVAVMAALLFDLGKAFDGQLTGDSPRLKGVLLPHRLTQQRLERAYEIAQTIQPGSAELLRAVLQTNPGSAIGGPPEVAQLAQIARSAVERAFGFDALRGV